MQQHANILLLKIIAYIDPQFLLFNIDFAENPASSLVKKAFNVSSGIKI